MSNNNIDQFFALSRNYFRLYLGISISVFLFILFFQPFTAIGFEFENRLLYITGFGLITFIIQFILQIPFQNYFIQQVADGEDDPLLNSVYYFLLLALTSVAFVFYIRYVGNTLITFTIVLRAVVICLSIPVTIHLNKKIKGLHVRHKHLLQETAMLKDKLNQFSENYANRFIELSSDSASDFIRVQVSEIVFVRSADNYVEVGIREGEEVKKKMIRNTLKNIEKQLKEFNNFIRTHRTSIVNIQYIDKLHKNFNTYWLTLEDTKETIPVSRQYLMVIKELF